MKLMRDGDRAISVHSFIDYHINIARFRILSFGKGNERRSDFSVDVDVTDVLRAILHMSAKDVPYASKIEELLRKDPILVNLLALLDDAKKVEEVEEREQEEKRVRE